MKFMLDLPWGFKYPGVKYIGDGLAMYSGTILPKELRPYASEDFSYARWKEDEANAVVQPPEKGNTVFRPRPHQVEAAKRIITSYNNGWRGLLEADGTGLGKGLRGSTLIPTPNGFTTMRKVKVGDTVLSPNGHTTKVIEKHVSHAGKFYKITFSDRTKVYSDSDHRWLTQNNEERLGTTEDRHYRRRISDKNEKGLLNYLEYAQRNKLGVTFKECCEAGNIPDDLTDDINHIFQELDHYGDFEGMEVYHPQEVLETLSKYNVLGGHAWNVSRDSVRDTEEIRKSLSLNHHGRFSVRSTHPIIGEVKELPVDPYVLGKWLMTGYSNGSGITSAEERTIEEASKNDPVLRSGLIPESYLTASVEQRLALLTGLMDIGGRVTDDDTGGVSFRHDEKGLFRQVHNLVCSLGWKATSYSEKVYIRNSTYQNCEELLFSPDKQVFRNSRKKEVFSEKLDTFRDDRRSQLRYIVSIDEVEKDDDYYCISVDSPDHLYLITESYIPTHNTLSSLSGITALAKQEGFGMKRRAKLLVVCPKSVIPQWRQTLHNYPVSSVLLRTMVINYQQLNKLLQAPPSARVVKKARTKNRQRATKGVPTVSWDFIIFDEAHYLKNYPSSTMSVAASNIARLDEPFRKNDTPFVVFSTATPGATPLNMAIMSGIVGPLVDDRVTDVSPAAWGEFLLKHGFAVSQGKSGWTWASVPGFGKNSKNPTERKKYEISARNAKKVQRKDSLRIGKALMKPGAPFVKRSPKDIAGWPEQQIVPFPITLTPRQQPIYEEAWTRFRKFLNLTPARKDPKTSLVETLRYRQKSSLLKVDSTAEFVKDLVDSGMQVYISCEFMETVDRYSEIFSKARIPFVEISGRNSNEREEMRLRFQKGEAMVVICDVVEGISLHAGEILPDGTRASSNDRATIIHDVRQNNLSTDQALGRAHRDGKNSVAYFPYIEKTVDENVISSYTNKTANMKSMTGSGLEDAEIFERIFRKAAAESTPPNRLS